METIQAVNPISPIYAYTYFNEYIELDELGIPINSKNYYVLEGGNQIKILFNEEYIVFVGYGYISLEPKIYNIEFNKKTEITLLYPFNYKIYQIKN